MRNIDPKRGRIQKLTRLDADDLFAMLAEQHPYIDPYVFFVYGHN